MKAAQNSSVYGPQRILKKESSTYIWIPIPTRLHEGNLKAFPLKFPQTALISHYSYSIKKSKRYMPCMSDSICWKLKGTLLQWCNSCLLHETYIVHVRVGFSVRWSSPSTHTCKTDLFTRLQLFLPLFGENTHCWILLNPQNWWINLCYLLTAH